MNPESSPNNQCPRISVDPTNPALLEGLETWLRLGLISDTQVKELSKNYLTCRLPQSVVIIAQEKPHSPNSTATDFAREEIPKSLRSTDEENIPPQIDVINQNISHKREQIKFLPRILQGLKDELSVRWLLFLGLFLVVVSSTVLTATQWQTFTHIGQYLVLFTYTLIFWGIGSWLSTKDNLQLTSRSLQILSILLIPVNFWGMDTFKLWSNGLGWLIMAITSSILTYIYYQYSKSRHKQPLKINFLGLSYLQWGWSISFIPIVAVYCGIIATTFVSRLLSKEGKINNIEGRGLLVYCLSILLIRAIFIVSIPIQQLGLAIGVCGWLFCTPKLTENESIFPPIGKVWESIGIILLVLGWLVSVGENLPWQAALISILALQFFWQRLQLYWLRGDLFIIFVVGLQELFLLWRLIPLYLRENILNMWVQITQTAFFPQSIYSLLLFPYLIAFLGLTEWLYRQSKPKLARFGEGLSLVLGVVLTIISLLNIPARSLNLLLSSLTLIYVTHRRLPIRVFLLHFTHLISLLALFSLIDWRFTDLNSYIWAKITLILMVGEWGISTKKSPDSESTIKQHWYNSCWLMGCFLASLSYILLLDQLDLFIVDKQTGIGLLWGLLIPLTLTGVAMVSQSPRHTQATFWSTGTLILVQWLTYWQPETRLIGLAVGTVLMLCNSYYVHDSTLAKIQIGFTLLFLLNWISLYFDTSWGEFLLFPQGLLMNAVNLTILWGLSMLLRQDRDSFANIYSQAAELWAVFLCIFNLMILTVNSLDDLYQTTSPSWYYLLATLLIGISLIYRYWLTPNHWVVYGVAWVLEILVTQGVLLTHNLFPEIAPTIATFNIILAFFTLWFSSWLLSSYPHLEGLTSLQVLPLIMAVMGIGWRIGHFTPYTGLLMVGAGMTGVMVSDRLKDKKLLSYLAIAVMSIGMYEITLYHLIQSKGGNIADGIMSLSLVSLAIAIMYRLLSLVSHLRGHQQILGISLKEIKIIAHLHWGIGIFFQAIALITALNNQSPPTLILLLLSLILSGYALLEARTEKQDIWVYFGLTNLFINVICIRLLWQQLSFIDPYGALIVCIFSLLLYHLPWHHWGWSLAPWQRVGLTLPFLIALSISLNLTNIYYLNILLIAAFYLEIAVHKKNIRWTYLSLVYIDYTFINFLLNNHLTENLFYAFIIGLSILYIAEVDRDLQKPNLKRNRHYLRILGSGIINLTALLFYQNNSITPAIISLTTLLIGLGLKIRAFLFVGTITFILTGIYQLIILSSEYPFLKWIIGLIAGIILITVAANFERRREQMTNILQNSLDILNQWE